MARKTVRISAVAPRPLSCREPGGCADPRCSRTGHIEVADTRFHGNETDLGDPGLIGFFSYFASNSNALNMRPKAGVASFTDLARRSKFASRFKNPRVASALSRDVVLPVGNGRPAIRAGHEGGIVSRLQGPLNWCFSGSTTVSRRPHLVRHAMLLQLSDYIAVQL